jgi:hypothetical protein
VEELAVAKAWYSLTGKLNRPWSARPMSCGSLKMPNDPILDEVHRVKDRLAAKYGYDVRLLGKAMQNSEKRRRKQEAASASSTRRRSARRAG